MNKQLLLVALLSLSAVNLSADAKTAPKKNKAERALRYHRAQTQETANRKEQLKSQLEQVEKELDKVLKELADYGSDHNKAADINAGNARVAQLTAKHTSLVNQVAAAHDAHAKAAYAAGKDKHVVEQDEKGHHTIVKSTSQDPRYKKPAALENTANKK